MHQGNDKVSRQRIPEDSAIAVQALSSIVIANADLSFVHKCASGSITSQRVEIWADVGESEVAKRRGNGAGWPGRVGRRGNEGVGRHRILEDPVAAVRMLGSIVIAAADPSFVHNTLCSFEQAVNGLREETP